MAELIDPTGRVMRELAVLVDAYRRHFGGVADPPATATWLSTWLDGQHGRVFVARVGDDPAGFALVVTTPATVVLGHAWQLRDLWVEPRHRRGGIARALVEHVCAAAAADGAARVSLTTERDNDAAVGLYRSCGFVDIAGYRTLARPLPR